MENILTKEIILKKVFEVRLLIISQIKKTALIIYNTKTKNAQTYPNIIDLPDSPSKYPIIDNKIDEILTKIGLDVSINGNGVLVRTDAK